MPQWIVSLAVGLTGLVGVLIGAWLTQRRERSNRQHQFLARQLHELYAPLVGLRTEVRVRSELRARVHSEADAAWHELVERARAVGIEAMGRISTERGPEFKKIIEYDNRVLVEELIPTYRKMLTTLRDHLWLAERETREYFPTLLEFVELWERWLSKTLPNEVLERLHHGEGQLKAFYDHIEGMHDRLRTAVSQGEVAVRAS